jgi:hypothetical protein
MDGLSPGDLALSTIQAMVGKPGRIRIVAFGIISGQYFSWIKNTAGLEE